MDNKTTPVLINLLAIVHYAQMLDYPVQMMTSGRYTWLGPEDAVIEYIEAQQDEETGAVTEAQITVTVSRGQVTIVRQGEFSNVLVFSAGRRFEGSYRTPYGEIPTALYAREVSCRLAPEGGAIHLKYQLHMQGSYASTNELHLEFQSDIAEEETEGTSEAGKAGPTKQEPGETIPAEREEEPNENADQ